ncbi:extracellular solute-binding protein [Litoreibacter sp.]|nr:extracellular solute-binding protein [Litoreibacter sp.]
MSAPPTQLRGITRRQALNYFGASATCVTVPELAWSMTKTPLQETVAGYARDLAGGQPVTLRLLMPNGSGGNVAPVIAAFKKMTGIEIETVETPVDEITVELLLTTLSNAQQFDLALPATFGLPDLVAANAIQPITGFSERYEPPGFRDDILFGLGDQFDDHLYGFQTDGDAYMMFYHKGMLESTDEKARYADTFGQPLSVPLTWQDLDQQMGFFNRPDESQWGGLLFRTPGYLAWEWWVRFHAKGVWPFSPEMEPQIASDQGVEALEELIRATEALCPEALTLGLFDNWSRYSKGDVYCNIGWGGSQKYFNSNVSAMRGNMIHGPTPGGVVDGTLISTPYFNWGWNYVVPSNSRHAELSYLFALFAATPAMSTLAVQQADGFFDPFRPEHYENSEIQSAYTTDFLDVHRASMENAIPDLYLQGQGEYFRILSEWLVRALAREVTPQLALERVAQRWRLITNSSGMHVQKQRWAKLRSKYPKKLRATLRDFS